MDTETPTVFSTLTQFPNDFFYEGSSRNNHILDTYICHRTQEIQITVENYLNGWRTSIRNSYSIPYKINRPIPVWLTQSSLRFQSHARRPLICSFSRTSKYEKEIRLHSSISYS